MAHYDLALLGFGNVGQALARLLQQKESEMKERYNITFRVTAIATGRHGMAIDPKGIDIDQAIELMEQAPSTRTPRMSGMILRRELEQLLQTSDVDNNDVSSEQEE